LTSTLLLPDALLEVEAVIVVGMMCGLLHRRPRPGVDAATDDRLAGVGSPKVVLRELALAGLDGPSRHPR
jgi:hypothetical protein